MMRIGQIGNYYGGIYIKTEDGKFYWGIQDYGVMDWEEITEALYNELSKKPSTYE